MAKLAIKGHSTRGKEVIGILEMLGGKNQNNVYSGKDTFHYYYIDNETGNIRTSFDNNRSWNKLTYSIFTLEEFLKKFPYKVGDKIKKKDSNEDVVLIIDIADNYYIVETKYSMEVSISINIQNNYELVPNKFDITTLKPFDKVLVRDNNEQKWTVDLFSFYNEANIYPFVCVGHYVNQCIPYRNNEHLLGKTEDCDYFYKTWE